MTLAAEWLLNPHSSESFWRSGPPKGGPFLLPHYSRVVNSRRSVTDVLLTAQRVGTLGNRPIDEVIAHALQFVDALDAGAHRVIDLGTGAGVPGLVIAEARPEVALTLVDRRQTRMDALQMAVIGLGWADRIQVLTAEADTLGGDAEHAGTYDAVVCRGFANPEITATLARPFLKNGGSLIVSEPPTFDPSRWPEELCKRAHFDTPVFQPGVVVLRANP
jgi:16S rRNA (guanine527-N7)-methyltransferase